MILLKSRDFRALSSIVQPPPQPLQVPLQGVTPPPCHRPEGPGPGRRSGGWAAGTPPPSPPAAASAGGAGARPPEPPLPLPSQSSLHRRKHTRKHVQGLEKNRRSSGTNWMSTFGVWERGGIREGKGALTEGGRREPRTGTGTKVTEPPGQAEGTEDGSVAGDGSRGAVGVRGGGDGEGRELMFLPSGGSGGVGGPGRC